MICVEDTGKGIPPSIVNRIFEPFFTTKDVGKGTGLGLSTVNSIVQNHNGFIEVESAVGIGTTFRVFFPSGAVHKQTTIEKPSTIPLGHGELVLIVDDESSMLQAAKEALESSNFRTLTARDGMEAIAVFTKQHNDIQLVVCDMMMPLLDGSKTVPILKKMKPSVKIVIASGSQTMNVEEDLAKQFDAMVIHKPYTVERLLSAIHLALK